MTEQQTASTTGATDEQIEAICRRRFASPQIYDMSAHLPSPTTPGITIHEYWMTRQVNENGMSLRDEATMWAALLVPVGYVIAREQDVITPEVRAAANGFVATGLHDYLEAAVDEETDAVVRFLRRAEIDSLNTIIRVIANGGTE